MSRCLKPTLTRIHVLKIAIYIQEFVCYKASLTDKWLIWDLVGVDDGALTAGNPTETEHPYTSSVL